MNSLKRIALLALAVACQAPPKGTAIDTASVEEGESVDVIGILITPGEVIVPVGGTVQLSAIGLNADRQSADLTDVVEWHSGAPSVAVVSNGHDEEGLLYGVASGTTMVTAGYDSVMSPSGRIVVTDANLSDLTISPPSVVLGVGDTIQLSAEARFSDGAAADASAQVRWITGDASVVTLSTTGELTGAGPGETTVSVEWDGVGATPIDVTVTGGGAGGGGTVDLAIADVIGTITDDYLNIWVEVENQGSATAAGFWVDVFVDPDGTPAYGDWPDTYDECDYVGPGDTSTVFVQAYATAETHELFVVVDSTDDVFETSESNNTAWATATSDSESGGDGEPNLVVDYFGYWIEDGVTEYWADVTNVGLGDASAFYVDVFHDSSIEPEVMTTGTIYQLIAGLPAGETEYLTFVVDEDCGMCISWLLLDSFALVTESVESDNTDYVEIGADVWTR
jgi:hypothetical protein